MEPTDTYLKSKKMMVLSSAVLILSVAFGLNYDASASAFPVKINNIAYVNEVVAAIVLYFTIQVNLFWAAQNQEVKLLPQYKWDFLLSAGIAALSLAVWMYGWAAIFVQYLENIDIISNVKNSFYGYVAVGIAALLSSLIAALTFYISKFGVKKTRDDKEKIEGMMLKALDEGEWILLFNPMSSKGFKDISFEEGGEIGVGRNKNEYSWRVRGGLLEIINSEGGIFSRFSYLPSANEFSHTNDDDTMSLRSQKILLKTNFLKR